MFEPRAREPFWNVLDFRVNRQQSAGAKKSRTGRTQWECVNKERARNSGFFQVFHRALCGLEEFVFLRPDIQTVCDLHYKSAGHA